MKASVDEIKRFAKFMKKVGAEKNIDYQIEMISRYNGAPKKRLSGAAWAGLTLVATVILLPPTAMLMGKYIEWLMEVLR